MDATGLTRPVLTEKDFIFNVATSEDYREKYLRRPELLSDKYDVPPQLLEAIKALDLDDLRKKLAMASDFETNGHCLCLADEDCAGHADGHSEGGYPHTNIHNNGW